MTTALYRRYRPDTFEEVIGQEHVTLPLANAIDKHRINHAYLFSGPRGCGKTTSARILARCLNCAQGPTAHPCGTCDSCTDLSTGGPGSLDVIEIDAASHGGVDDARDLRERATFAPTRDRYKIFIIDEAHMVTSAGFNALLKIVEEPPEHIKFIFATTEPDKVIGTIRSRTHHYPFRLVPPEPLLEHLEALASAEQVAIAPGVLSLVIRAGGGSVRDTLSVLDQLIAGATEEGVSYDLAVNLLGFTPENLLDDVLNALAAEDSGTVFRVVDQVVQSGQDPERFVQDLLERFRDVVIVKAAPEQAAGILHGMPADQMRRLEAQANQLGPAEVSRSADITAAALTQMSGATSPRLHLELLMARLMLPATDETERGLAARIDRLERRIEYGGVPEAPATPQSTAVPAAPARSGSSELSGAAAARAALAREQEQADKDDGLADLPQQAPAQPAAQPAPSTPAPGQPAQQQAAQPQQQQQPVALPVQPSTTPAQQTPQSPASPAQPAPQSPAAQSAAPQSPASQPAAEQSPSSPAPAAQPAPASQEQPVQPAKQPSQVEMVRRAWPEVLEFLKNESRLIWMTVNGNAQVVGYDGKLLTIGFDNDGARNTVQMRGGAQLLAAGFHQVLGIQPELDLISGITGGGSPKEPSRQTRPQPSQSAPARPTQTPAAQQQPPVQQPPVAPPAQQPPVQERPTQQQQPPAQQQPSQPAPPVQHQPPVQQPPAESPAAPPQAPAEQQQRPAQPAPAPQRPAPNASPIHPTPPATGVTGWGTGEPNQAWGQPDQAWGQPEQNQAWDQSQPDHREPGPNWGPPEDDEAPPPEDPWESAPQQPVPHQPQESSGPPAQPSVQSPAAEQPPAAEPTLSTGPDPVAEDGYAGFLPRSEPAEEPFAPAFAKSEAQLREEFKRRFSDVIPSVGGAKKPQQETTKPAGSRFADMVAQYDGQQPAQTNTTPDAAPEEPATDDDDDYASDDDEIIEESGLAGRSVVEEVLNARLVEERNADGSPKL